MKQIEILFGITDTFIVMLTINNIVNFSIIAHLTCMHIQNLNEPTALVIVCQNTKQYHNV